MAERYPGARANSSPFTSAVDVYTLGVSTHTDPEPPVPLVVADSLSVATPRGLVFHPFSAEIPDASTVAIAGRPDAGKSSLLLALTGRMRGAVGELSVSGVDGIAHPGRVRKITSVARISDIVVPEPSLSLDDCITERMLADAAPPRSRLANYLHTAELLGLDAPRSTLFGALTPADQTKVAVALATIRPARLIVLDDLDHGATLIEQERLWAGLRALSAEGVTVIAATSELASIPPEVLTFEMDPRHA